VAPKIDIREDATSITIEAELRGMKKDIAVTLSNGILTIKGEKKQNEENTRTFRRKSYGAFQRSLQLLDSIAADKVEAKFDKGALKITAAKKSEAVKAQRKIEIQSPLSMIVKGCWLGTTDLPSSLCQLSLPSRNRSGSFSIFLRNRAARLSIDR